MIRNGHLIDPSCAICQGAGNLTLHPAALSVYDPVTVSDAIAIACEASAKLIDSAHSLSEDLTAMLAAKVGELAAVGIIRTPTPAAAPALDKVRPIRRQIPEQATLTDAGTRATTVATQYGPPPTLFDPQLVEAAPHRYTEDDPPMMRGLTVLSTTGHPSSLARITYPVDQLVGTRDHTRARAAQRRQATILVAAIPQTIKQKNRKTG